MDEQPTIEDRIDEIENKIDGIADALQFVMRSVGKTIKSPLIGIPDKTVTLAEGYTMFCHAREEQTPRV